MKTETVKSKHISQQDLMLKRHQMLFNYGELMYERDLLDSRLIVIDDQLTEIKRELETIETLIEQCYDSENSEENLENSK